MSKYTAQMKALIRSHKALTDYAISGQLPRVTAPQSPLITYLESIAPRERVRGRRVTLSPALGYQIVCDFGSLQSMLNYLKPSPWVDRAHPAESRRIKSFVKPINTKLFEDNQKKALD